MALTFRLTTPNPVFDVKPEAKEVDHNPAATLMDEDGNVQGTPANPLWVNAVLIATSNLSVGPNGDPIPLDSTQVGGEDAAGDLQAVEIRSADPVGTERGFIVRNIPSGTQEVSAPGGAALALDATLTNGTQLAQVVGTGTAGAPVAGVVSVQGVVGGTPVPVSGTVTAVNLSVGVNGAAMPTSSTQVGGEDGTGNLQAVEVRSAAPVGTEIGFVTRNIPSGTQDVQGALTTNNAAPGATNVGVLPGVANAATPSHTEGRQVLSSTDLSGATRVTGGQTATATLSSVASSAANVTLLASNTARKGVVIVNDGNKTLYVKYGATATTASYSVLMPSNAYWEMPWPIYTGQIDGIWSAANGNARITEL